jgi:SPP1 gp7 family putative phage head morphogenesis protein
MSDQTILDVGIRLRFDLVNPESIKFLENYAFDQIEEISAETRERIRQVLLRAFKQGGHPFQQAREIRQWIGLTARQDQDLADYRSALENNSPAALERPLRDRRFDRSVAKAIQQGRALDEARIDKLVARYRELLVQDRARTIARTETIRAANEGQRESWRQARDHGLLDPATTRRVWIASGDSNTCATCLALNGKTVGLNEEFPGGDPPCHPKCRCSTGLKFT